MTTVATPQTPAGTAAPRRPNAWLVAGAVLGAAMILMGAVSFAGLVAPRHEETADVRLPAAAHLVVRVDSGDVTVRGDDGDQIAGSAQRVWSFAQPRLTTSRDGDTAEVRVDCGWLSVGYCHSTVELSVPRGTAVDLYSSSGHVSAAGLHGDATLATSSGPVTATDVTGDVTARSSSGDLSVTGVTGDLDLAVSSGRIEVSDTAASHVTAAASSGDIRLDLADDPETVEAHTSSGRVQVLLPDTPGVAYRLDLRATSGTTDGAVRTDPDSPRTIAGSATSGDVEVGYRG